MRLHKAGLSHRHANDFSICRPHGSGDWLLLVIKSPARFTVGGQECDVEPYSVILYPKVIHKSMAPALVNTATTGCILPLSRQTLCALKR